jgi:hypothetical protein
MLCKAPDTLEDPPPPPPPPLRWLVVQVISAIYLFSFAISIRVYIQIACGEC